MSDRHALPGILNPKFAPSCVTPLANFGFEGDTSKLQIKIGLVQKVTCWTPGGGEEHLKKPPMRIV